MALGLAVSTSVAHGTATQPPLYTRAATQACLTRLPNAITGLPPATAPVPPRLFVHALARDEVGALGSAPRAHTQLVAWYGDASGDYRGVLLNFFKDVADARASRKALDGKQMRNVVSTWTQQAGPSQTVRQEVLGCLRSGAAAGQSAPAPAASLATFAGKWGGHTRGLSIAANGRGSEFADDGCCTRAYRMTFQILSATGTVTRATARFRVTSFSRVERGVKLRHTGDVGRLLLRNGIVTNTLSGVYFCSDPAWSTTGACGA